MKKIILSIMMMLVVPFIVQASETDGTIVTGTNIGFAWSNNTGWINFGLANGNIHITDTAITGYAWSQNFGWINMAPTNGGITVAANGALTGNAWSTGLGWINFSGVTINSVGKFTGQATGVGVGTLTFDCSSCDVRTDYRPANSRTSSSVSTSGGTTGGTAAAPAVAPSPTPTPTSPSPTGEPIQPPTGELPSTITVVTEEVVPDEGGADIAEGELLPSELFDIRLVIDRRTITSIRDLVARTTFESFGRIPTPVDLTFSIIDADGDEVYTKKDNVVIQTEGVLVTRFVEVSDLSDGEYILRVRTLYNVDVEDNFEIPFTINAGVKKGFGEWWMWALVIVFGIGLLALFRYIYVRRRCAKCLRDRSCEVCIAQKLCKRCDPDEHRLHQMIIR